MLRAGDRTSQEGNGDGGAAKHLTAQTLNAGSKPNRAKRMDSQSTFSASAGGNGQEMATDGSLSGTVGDDVRWEDEGDSTMTRNINVLSWNAARGLKEERIDYLMEQLQGGRRLQGKVRTHFDFFSVQEPGQTWAVRQQGGAATLGPRDRLLQLQSKVEGDVLVTSWRAADWRVAHTSYVVLGWAARWEARRWGKPLCTKDGRTVAVQFATANGRVAMVAHYGVTAPKHTDAQERSKDGPNAAATVAQMLDMVKALRDRCTLVVLAGDLNTQRASDRLGKPGGSGERAQGGASEVLWHRTMQEGGFKDTMASCGHPGTWTRQLTAGGVRTRPDWALATADWTKWTVQKAGVLAAAETYGHSDHRILVTQLRATDVDPAVRKLGVRRRMPAFTTKNATAEQWAAFDKEMSSSKHVVPTHKNWEAEGRSEYERLMKAVRRAAISSFGAAASNAGRPWWDRQAGKDRKVLRFLGRLAGRLAGAQVPEKLRRALSWARKQRHKPKELDLDGMDVTELGVATDRMAKQLVRRLRLRWRKRRIRAEQEAGLRERGGPDLRQLIRRSLRRYTDSKDPYAALMDDGKGGTVLTADEQKVKEAAKEMANRWFTSIKHHARYVVTTAPGLDRDELWQQVVGRPGWRAWKEEKGARAAAAAIGEEDGQPTNGDLWTLTAEDAQWMRRRDGVLAVERESAAYTVWFRPQATEQDIDLALDELSGQALRYGANRSTSMGLMVNCWLTGRQRDELLQDEMLVVGAIPVVAEYFFDNSEDNMAGLTALEREVWGLDATRAKAAVDHDGHGQYVDPKKLTVFNALMKPQSFDKMYRKALRKVRTKAAPGHDDIGIDCLRHLTEQQHVVLREHLRLSVTKMDVVRFLTKSVIKWLPKDGKKSPYLDNRTHEAPNRRPIGLNTAASKVLEYILFEVQQQINDEAAYVTDDMYAWHRGRTVYMAAFINEMVMEHARDNGRDLHVASIDAYHWFDTVHTESTVQRERQLGYPPALIAAKAAIRMGSLSTRTLQGDTSDVQPEQGLGQGRVEAPTDSNRVAAAVARAVGPGADPYTVEDMDGNSVQISAIDYADDRNRLAGGCAGLEEGVKAMNELQYIGGGRVRPDKCFYRSSVTAEARGSQINLEMRDPTTGTVRRVAAVGSQVAKRFLGHYSSMDLRSRRGAQILERECAADLRNLSRRSVSRFAFEYVLRSVLGGRVASKTPLTRGMREAMRRTDRRAAIIALHKMGEKSTSGKHFLYASASGGAAISNMEDELTVATIGGYLKALRMGTQTTAGFMAADGGRRLCTVMGAARPWGLRTQYERAGPAEDDSVAERLRRSLDDAGVQLHRSGGAMQRPRHGDAGGVQGGVAADGGRWCDWGLADVLPADLERRTRAVRLRAGVRWVGQLLQADGSTIAQAWLAKDGGPERSLITWLRAFIGTPQGRQISRLDGGLDVHETLRVGEFAMIAEVREEEDGVTVTGNTILIQGCDDKGRTGRGAGAAAVPEFSQGDGRPHVKVARWSITENAATPHGRSYVRQGTMRIELPNDFRRLRPKMEEGGALAFPGPPGPANAGVLPGQLCEDDVARLCQAAELRWAGDGDLGDDRCLRCGGRLGRSGVDGLHPICQQHERAWAKMLEGNCRTWLCDQEDGLPRLPALGFVQWPEGEVVLATDGSVKDGVGGAAMVMEDVEQIVRVRLTGRREEMSSYQAELMMAILMVRSIPADKAVTWVGDNKSVQMLYTDHEWQREQSNSPDGDTHRAASLRRWFALEVDALHGRGSSVRAVHQRSHLTLKGAPKDHRRLLRRADEQAEKARTDAVHLINVSGRNPGCKAWEMYDSAGWRVDGNVSSEVRKLLRARHLRRWQELPVQGQFLREDGVDRQALSWGQGAKHKRTRTFASKLHRRVLATELDRMKHDKHCTGCCRVCKWGPWDGESEQAEVSVQVGGVRGWRRCTVIGGPEDGTLRVKLKGGAAQEVPLSQVRRGRWSVHSDCHVLGVGRVEKSLEESKVICIGQHAKLLTTAIQEAHGERDRTTRRKWRPYELACAMRAGTEEWLWASEISAAQHRTMSRVEELLVEELRRRRTVTEALSDSGQRTGLNSTEKGALLRMLTSAEPSAQRPNEKQRAETMESCGDQGGTEQALERRVREMLATAWKGMEDWDGEQLTELTEQATLRARKTVGGEEHPWRTQLARTIYDRDVGCGGIVEAELRSIVGTAVMERTGDTVGEAECTQLIELHSGAVLGKGPERAVGRTRAGQEPKVETRMDRWTRRMKQGDLPLMPSGGGRAMAMRTRTLADWQVRVWAGFIGDDKAGWSEAWRALPPSGAVNKAHTAREELLRTLVAAGGVTAVYGVAAWNIYSWRGAKYGDTEQGCGPLGLEAAGQLAALGSGQVIMLARPMTAAWLAQAKVRTGTTFGVWVGAGAPADDGCRVLARFDANSYCPEWMRGSISSEGRRVCKKNAINNTVSVVECRGVSGEWVAGAADRGVWRTYARRQLVGGTGALWDQPPAQAGLDGGADSTTGRGEQDGDQADFDRARRRSDAAVQQHLARRQAWLRPRRGELGECGAAGGAGRGLCHGRWKEGLLPLSSRAWLADRGVVPFMVAPAVRAASVAVLGAQHRAWTRHMDLAGCISRLHGLDTVDMVMARRRRGQHIKKKIKKRRREGGPLGAKTQNTPAGRAAAAQQGAAAMASHLSNRTPTSWVNGLLSSTAVRRFFQRASDTKARFGDGYADRVGRIRRHRGFDSTVRWVGSRQREGVAGRLRRRGGEERALRTDAGEQVRLDHDWSRPFSKVPRRRQGGIRRVRSRRARRGAATVSLEFVGRYGRQLQGLTYHFDRRALVSQDKAIPTRIAKSFDGHVHGGTVLAKVAEQGGEGLYEVRYDDNDNQHMTESEIRRHIVQRGPDRGLRLRRLRRSGVMKAAVMRLMRGWCRGLPMERDQLHSFVARTLEDCGGLPRYQRDDGGGVATSPQDEDDKADDRPRMMMDDAGAATESRAASGDGEEEQEDERQPEPPDNDDIGEERDDDGDTMPHPHTDDDRTGGSQQTRTDDAAEAASDEAADDNDGEHQEDERRLGPLNNNSNRNRTNNGKAS